jgi:hypothetical protein
MNIWAILVAAAAAQVIGGLWYSPMLFAKVWLREAGLTEAQIKARPSLMPFIVAVGAGLVLAAALALLHLALKEESFGGALWAGLWVGVVAGVGISAASSAPHYAFTGKSRLLFLIDQAQTLANCVVMSLIIALWRSTP